MTGVAAHNVSGAPVQVIVQYGGVEERQSVPDQARSLVVSNFYDESNPAPQLRKDLESIAIIDGSGRRQVYNREQVMQQSRWDQKARVWILTIRPR